MFDSPTTIRQKLEESFSEKLASTEFQIGYIEKRCNAKRWIEEPSVCMTATERGIRSPSGAFV